MQRKVFQPLDFSLDAQKPLGIVYVTPSAECLREERDHILQALAALTVFTKTTAETGIMN